MNLAFPVHNTDIGSDRYAESYLEACSLLSSISTNATDDDLPGPGRTLGILFDFSGKHLETGLNRVLEKLPKRFRPRQYEATSSFPDGRRATNADVDAIMEDDLEICSLVPTISTTATADNLPGPGYTVGRFYSFAGKRMETNLGQLAEKLGKGPLMTASRIHRRRMKASTLPSGSRKLEKKNAKVKKDCKKLLKYARSRERMTKLQALDRIIQFIVGDRFVHAFFLSIGAVDVIQSLQKRHSRSSDYDSGLLSSSRKALFSLADTDVNVLAQNIEAMIVAARMDMLDPRVESFKDYIKDPDRAFLVLRHLINFSDKLDNLYVMRLVEYMINFAQVPLNSIEWPSLDRLIERYLAFIINTSESFGYGWEITSRILVPLMEMILRYAERLPVTLSSAFFSWLTAVDDSEHLSDRMHAFFSWCLLRGIGIRHGITDATFQVNLDLLRLSYPHTAVQPLLRRITCVPEILLCRILMGKYGKAEMTDCLGRARVVDPKEMEHICRLLSLFVDSRDYFVRQRALHVFKYLLATDIYWRTESLRAFSTTTFALTTGYTTLIQASYKPQVQLVDRWSAEVVRHCDIKGNVIHIYNKSVRESCAACHDVLEGTLETLTLESQDVLELHIPRGTPFNPRGHTPILAGTNCDGQNMYIAQPVSKSGYRVAFVSVTEGMKPEELRMWSIEPPLKTVKKVVPLYVVVFVLRYAPSVYAGHRRNAVRSSDAGAQLGFDATGPYSWKPRHFTAQRFARPARFDPESTGGIPYRKNYRIQNAPVMEDESDSEGSSGFTDEDCETGDESEPESLNNTDTTSE